MRKTIIVGAIGLGLVTTIGIGTAAYATFDKAVTLTVDGKPRTVHSFGRTVDDVLSGQKIHLSARDRVAPSGTTAIRDGSEISVRYARPLTLTLDGKTSRHWVTALSVGDALHQLEVRDAGLALSTSRSTPLGRKGLHLSARTPKRITVVHDHTSTRITAPVLTVDQALVAADIAVDADDRVSPAATATVLDGTTIRVQRVDTKKQQVDVSLPYTTVRKADSSMYKGNTKTVRAGKKGVEHQVLSVLYLDGRRSKATVLSRTVATEPVTRIVAYGTKAKPTYGGGNVGGSVDNLNWPALARCESGGNPRAVNPNGHYGLYQFSLSTWHAVGGSGNPIDASSAEQTYRAKILYKRAGAGQWSCGSHLYD